MPHHQPVKMRPKHQANQQGAATARRPHQHPRLPPPARHPSQPSQPRQQQSSQQQQSVSQSVSQSLRPPRSRPSHSQQHAQHRLCLLAHLLLLQAPHCAHPLPWQRAVQGLPCARRPQCQLRVRPCALHPPCPQLGPPSVLRPPSLWQDPRSAQQHLLPAAQDQSAHTRRVSAGTPAARRPHPAELSQ